MGRRSDISRAESGIVFRNGVKIVESEYTHGELTIGTAPEVKPKPLLYLMCNKCKTLVSRSFVEKHINTCWGGKAECGKCHVFVPARDFLAHFDSCLGKKVEVKNANTAVPKNN